jgi:hypothetical protein
MMLYDTLSIQEVVDSESADEFLKEASKLASSSELENIARQLEKKQTMFAEYLRAENLVKMETEDFAQLMNHIFSIRRRAAKIVKAVGVENLRAATITLLYGEGETENRFEAFVKAISKTVDRRRCINLASELLHFNDPQKNCLWTNWIWDSQTGSGAISMVVNEEVELDGKSDSERYRNISAALRMVEVLGHSRNISGNAAGMLGMDLYLACVHAVYMYTVFRLKMSDEFNRILPELPELVERVLGVRQLEVSMNE